MKPVIVLLALAALAGPALAQKAERPEVKAGDQWRFETRINGVAVKWLDRLWVVTSVTPLQIERTLYGAFGVIRERSTGTKFLTCFIDEMDGSLDPEARMKYFAMLEALHHESGRKHTIVITHSETAQEAIAQRIIMAELARESAGRTA